MRSLASECDEMVDCQPATTMMDGEVQQQQKSSATDPWKKMDHSIEALQKKTDGIAELQETVSRCGDLLMSALGKHSTDMQMILKSLNNIVGRIEKIGREQENLRKEMEYMRQSPPGLMPPMLHQGGADSQVPYRQPNPFYAPRPAHLTPRSNAGYTEGCNSGNNMQDRRRFNGTPREHQHQGGRHRDTPRPLPRPQNNSSASRLRERLGAAVPLANMTLQDLKPPPKEWTTRGEGTYTSDEVSDDGSDDGEKSTLSTVKDAAATTPTTPVRTEGPICVDAAEKMISAKLAVMAAKTEELSSTLPKPTGGFGASRRGRMPPPQLPPAMELAVGTKNGAPSKVTSKGSGGFGASRRGKPETKPTTYIAAGVNNAGKRVDSRDGAGGGADLRNGITGSETSAPAPMRGVESRPLTTEEMLVIGLVQQIKEVPQTDDFCNVQPA